MPATFLVVPEWQGSSSSRAMRLIDGAEAIAGDLPRAATRSVEVPLGAGESLDTGVHRYSALVATRERAAAALDDLDGLVITIGGDCGADLASASRAVAAHPTGSVAVVWFDAHADLNSAASSPSGAFGGMSARALLGDAPEGLNATGSARLAPDHLVVAGARSFDDAELAFIDEAGVLVVTVDELSEPDALVAAVERSGAASVYIHVDLDVLDPATMTGVGAPEPFGLQPETLCDAVRALRSRFELAGAGITGFAPASADAAAADMPVILRVLGSLTSPLS
ncbi:arginase family protein [Microbacterium sp. STN6]|uniref:arginase family protein n=1 Tax=Microbacterium sp. STN6 TaxID=2995588 RepID=UPI002260BA00|nr:arginase family protein [Microbacterium sp. STN6]MCX7521139.1 arginase family protein [Microbacterium sp. STN6]